MGPLLWLPSCWGLCGGFGLVGPCEEEGGSEEVEEASERSLLGEGDFPAGPRESSSVYSGSVETGGGPWVVKGSPKVSSSSVDA